MAWLEVENTKWISAQYLGASIGLRGTVDIKGKIKNKYFIKWMQKFSKKMKEGQVVHKA